MQNSNHKNDDELNKDNLREIKNTLGNNDESLDLMEQFHLIKENLDEIYKVFMIGIDFSSKTQVNLEKEQNILLFQNLINEILTIPEITFENKQFLEHTIKNHTPPSYQDLLILIMLKRINQKIDESTKIRNLYLISIFHEIPIVLFEFPDFSNPKEKLILNGFLRNWQDFRLQNLKNSLENQNYRNFENLFALFRENLLELKKNIMLKDICFEIYTAGDPKPKSAKHQNLNRLSYQYFKDFNSISFLFVNLLGKDGNYYYRNLVNQYSGKYWENPQILEIYNYCIENDNKLVNMKYAKKKLLRPSGIKFENFDVNKNKIQKSKISNQNENQQISKNQQSQTNFHNKSDWNTKIHERKTNFLDQEFDNLDSNMDKTYSQSQKPVKLIQVHRNADILLDEIIESSDNSDCSNKPKNS